MFSTATSLYSRADMREQGYSQSIRTLNSLSLLCFFFSSRRRHTRFDCDWSSDVCSSDLYGIGYAGLLYHNPGVKPLALAAKNGAPFVEPTRLSVLNHSYPLTRMITIFLNRAPRTPPEPKLQEFLRYVLSREGQQAVLREGHGYLPILAPFTNEELQKLGN